MKRMPSTVVAVISAVLLLVVLAIAVPLRNKIREDQAAQRQKDEEALVEREALRRVWAEEDALLDEEGYEEGAYLEEDYEDEENEDK